MNRSTDATVTRCGSIHIQTTRRHRAAITAVFAGNGILFASLFSRLPEIQERLGLDEGELGLVLLAAPAGLIGAVVLAGAQVARTVPGAWRPQRRGYAGVLSLPSLAPNAALALALFALGATSGALDVAMNTQGIAIERRYPRRIFASLHAVFSFGALAGAAAGGLVAQAGVPLMPTCWGSARSSRRDGARDPPVRARRRTGVAAGRGAARRAAEK